METPLTAHGIYRNRFMYSGSSGIAAAIAVTIVCFLERKRGESSGTSLISTTGSGHLSASMDSSLCDQEPVSVALSALNLAVQFHGWVSFFILINYKLPFRPNKTAYYEYSGLWHVYAIFAMNTWFWSAVFHSRDVELTERLDCSSGVALLAYSLFLAIVRAFNIRAEAARVMIATPIFAFMITHILYLNFYDFNLGLNMKACMAMGGVQMVVWAAWAGATRHPSRRKLWMVVLGGALALLLEICDFPPYWGLVDAHAVWHATTVPATYLWWSFVRDDSVFRTSALVKKTK
ncbi:uncharacterized protein LOC127245932 isoform X2 [Andrographis paniculata]|uniref:uncharacterized protein LOC127245932 isoform X2 n=1 Tax=Andrographis paniculata TaxID=175694 RepID=UPI0021E727F0|nr:uncharacterized protein LOC127245932 isoform X2 [Andrographis paniculata]